MLLNKNFLLIILTFVQANGDRCLTNDDNPYLKFATITSYEVIRGSASSETTCKPIQIWLLSRHGTRHADPEEFSNMKLSLNIQEKIVNNYESGRSPYLGGLCINDYLAIKNWTWDKSVENKGNFLTQTGWEELYGIAKRYRNRYPQILGGSYRVEDYYFRHTDTQRTLESCKAFIDGIFGNGTNKNVVIQKPLDFDAILEPFSSCKAWIDKVNDNPDRREETRIFARSSDYLDLIHDVTNRLGLNKLLKHIEIHSMYHNCRYDKTRYMDRISPWCAVFTKKQLVLLEYYQDLIRYYKCSYGNMIHEKLGCMPLRHLLETFSKTVLSEKVVGPKLTAMFTHDTSLDMFYTAMKYGRDQKRLKGYDYEDMFINRRYSTSENTPFGGNVAAVLHECGPEESEKYKVQFFLNEKQMPLPGCDRGLCGWEHLEQFYADVFHCNLDFCNDD